ncbi:coproporphyrinogen dehydrogenase HemZ [Scatolibacter rhodanostii]|uniref:coproporphyrinogen dehydrogenase HemZ n=1 Tax=Scatolibacter rhodanostii TaxID=2014781 RepID=UPI000C08868C|nr:coproporphyrinogen dehydrogenase HemZ [Scatolibacter rhodanostii]
MQLYLSGHSFQFECENICRLFFPYSPIQKIELPLETESLFCSAVITETENGYTYTITLSENGKKLSSENVFPQKDEYQLTRLLFALMVEFTGYTPPWGMLTGIHPVKLLHSYAQENDLIQAQNVFRHQFFVSEKKILLAKKTLQVQAEIVDNIGENDFSLYVGIPFCPTRCSYCSFVAQSIEKSKKLIDPYFALLLKEIEKTAEVSQNLGLRLRSVYVGGGTPTTLSASQLNLLCETVQQNFDMSRCTEFTVEAGRPDTITEEKLAALKEAGVGRISINPQSMSNEVLEAIGRSHQAEDVTKAFEAAKKAGITLINSDLIAGLPKDTIESFRHTLDSVLNLGATNVTVHCLALKRAASLDELSQDIALHKQTELVNQMVDESITRLEQDDFLPYYLYRQSRIAGNLENTGWAKKNDLCAYNIYTMDESMTVLACGAGAVSKIKDPYSNRLERIFNFKYPTEYINRNEEILKRKDGVAAFYEQFRKRIY